MGTIAAICVGERHRFTAVTRATTALLGDLQGLEIAEVARAMQPAEGVERVLRIHDEARDSGLTRSCMTMLRQTPVRVTAAPEGHAMVSHAAPLPGYLGHEPLISLCAAPGAPLRVFAQSDLSRVRSGRDIVGLTFEDIWSWDRRPAASRRLMSAFLAWVEARPGTPRRTLEVSAYDGALLRLTAWRDGPTFARLDLIAPGHPHAPGWARPAA